MAHSDLRRAAANAVEKSRDDADAGAARRSERRDQLHDPAQQPRHQQLNRTLIVIEFISLSRNTACWSD
jgi:hypothetical protein